MEVAHFLELRPLILTSLERLSRRAAARTGPHSQAGSAKPQFVMDMDGCFLVYKFCLPDICC